MHQWFVFEEFDEACSAAADFIADKIVLAINKNNICHVALPGGNSPKKCLGYLITKSLPWEKIHWYLGDERCYPLGHAERNDVMLEKYLWSHLPATNIHKIPAELGAEEAASLYEKEIENVKAFDIAFLGLGEDGHTASLFPDNKALNDNRRVVPVFNSLKAPNERVSLSITTLQTAECRIVLSSGSGKAKIISRIKKGDSLPVNLIGDINWFIDKEALLA